MVSVAFDIGTKRIGVAYSDERGKHSFPEKTLLVTSKLFDDIFSLLEKYKPELLVVGMPATTTVKKNPIVKHIQKFISECEQHFGLPVVSVNESGSSQMAHDLRLQSLGVRYDQSSKRELSIAKNDSDAAVIILQRYLDSVH